MEIFFDNSATTKMAEQAAKVQYEYSCNYYYNPSSRYKPSLNVNLCIREAKEYIAEVMGGDKEHIYFTSGATESNNTAILGLARALRHPSHFVTSSTEHASILEVFGYVERMGHSVSYVAPNSSGEITAESVASEIKENTVLVSIMHVNNETGAINDLKEISRAVKAINSKTLIHSDGVNAFLKVPLNIRGFGIDMYSISANKFHGPKGVGILYLDAKKHEGGLIGGGQQGNIRSGTENVPGIMAMAEAIKIYMDNKEENLNKMLLVRKTLIDGLKEIEDSRINGQEDGSPHIINVSFKDVKGEVLLHMLESENIYVGLGSACSSHKKGYSHVLIAMDVPNEYLGGSIRLSLSPENTVEEAEIVLSTINKSVERLRKYVRR